MRYFIGAILMGAALLFATLETLYFGGNWAPQSRAELVCDIIALGMLIAGVALTR
jgi:hypothetical protein